MSTFAPTRRRLSGLVAGLLIAVALPAAAAHASPFEQISRDNGTLGGMPLWGIGSKAAAVGDVGRYAGFERQRSNGDYGPDLSLGYVRDVQTNTTIDYGGGVQRIYGFDRAEKRALIGRTRGGQYQVAVVPIAGGAPIIVAQRPVITTDRYRAEAQISGDGRHVVVSWPAGGTDLYDLAGSTVTLYGRLSTDFLRFDSHSLSDTANVVIGYNDNQGPTTRVFRKGGNTLQLDTPAAVVDAKGTSLAWIANYSELVLRKLVPGAERRWDISSRVESPMVLRVADNGTSAVVSSGRFYGNGASTLTPGAGTSYTLTPFGGRFASSITGEYDRTIISPSGRFALVPQGGVTIVDTTNAHIVGANDLFSAAAYVFAGSFISVCAEPATFSVHFMQPAPFGPSAKKMTVLATGGGNTIVSGTLTKSIPADGSIIFNGEAYTGPEYTLEGTYDPSVVKSVQLKVSVTDANNKVQTETWTELNPYC